MESVSFQIPTGYGDLRIAEKALRNLLALHKAEASIIENCKIALQDLLMNIIENSYGSDNGKMIGVKLRVDKKRLIVEIKDSNMPVNLMFKSLTTSDPAELKPGGYDMAIVKELMDDVQYQYKNNKNIWTLIKNI